MIDIFLLFLVSSSHVYPLDNKGLEITFAMEALERQDYSFSEAAWLHEIGEPNLPSVIYKIGIPQDSDIEFTILENREQIVQNITIEPVRHLGIYEPPFPETVQVYGSVYEEDRFFPQALVELSEPAYFRDIYTVEVRLNPVRYNPVSRALKVSRSIKVGIRFKETPQEKPILDTSFEEIYKKTIVNYEQCKSWRREPKRSAENPFSQGVWFRIEVDEEGLYRIGYDEIRNSGLDPAQFDPMTMKIYTAAFDLLPEAVDLPFPDSLVEVPVYVKGEDDHAFDSGDYLVFYGFPASHFISDTMISWFENGYARSNIYWFTFGGEFGRRMERIDASWNGETPDTIATEIMHFEVDVDNPTRSGINWFWADVSASGTEPGYHSFVINHPEAQGDARIAVGIFTLSYGTRIYRCNLDGEVFFDDTLSLSPTSSMPPRYLRGNGVLSGDSSRFDFYVHAFPDEGTVYFNSVDLEYERFTYLGQPFHASILDPQSYTIKCYNVGTAPFVLDITDLRAPKMFDNYTTEANSIVFSSMSDSSQLLYFSKAALAKSADLISANPGDLRTESAGCEYLVITHTDFSNAILPLVDYRRRDYSTKVVTIDAVFDDFSFGKYDPLAIKHFLYFTLNNWTTVPQYVLLVGDAIYDYKNNRGVENPPNFIPMYERGTTLSGNPGIPPNYIYEGEYVNFGAGEVMALGRITVRTTKEVRDFVDKLITYETKDIDGIWNKRIILAGDDEYARGWESPFDHCGACETTSVHVPDTLYDFAKVYMISFFPFPPHQSDTRKPDATNAFMRELNKGGYAGAYYGHGNVEQLAHEVLFAYSDITRIRNDRRYFFFYFGSCTVGRFDDQKEGIGEELVRIKDGAIGTLGATAGTGCGPNTSLGKTLFSCLTDPDTNLTLGECCLIAKDGLWHLHYVLLGDPATRLRRVTERMVLEATPESLRPIERLRITSDENSYFLKAFVRDADTITVFDDSTFDKIAGYVYRLVETNSGYVAFGYAIDGKEIYEGFWSDDTAVIIAPKVQTVKFPIIKLSSFAIEKSGFLDSTKIYGSAAPSSDTLGPDVALYDGARKLHDGDWVDQSFTLTGKVTDVSGVDLLHSVTSARGFYLQINQGTDRIDLRDYFIYDRNSYTSGEFTVNLVLPEPVDTLTINVNDNHFNRTISTIVLNAETAGDVSMDNFLVYPNPLQSESGIWFTFTLSRSGLVDIKIFTIAGRLIKTISDVYCSTGYNQIDWNTLDDFQDEISNGVYLVKVVVESSGAQDEIIERFIIAR